MYKTTSLVFALTLLLSACLGGGGGGTSSPVPSPLPADPDLQTSVPEPNYGGDPFRLTIFQMVNDIRNQLGMGLLAQNIFLDQAAENHSANVGATKDGADRIYEDIDIANGGLFTGVTPQERCAYVGYLGGCPDVGIWGGSLNSFDQYSALLVLSQGAREMGIAARSDLFMTPITPYIQLGYPAGKSSQRQTDGFQVATYLWGAFHVQVNEGETLAVDAYQVWNAAGQEVTGQVLTSDTDPFHRVPANAAMLVTSGLACDGGAYTLHFAGKRNGQSFTVNKTLTLAAPFCYETLP